MASKSENWYREIHHPCFQWGLHQNFRKIDGKLRILLQRCYIWKNSIEGQWIIQFFPHLLQKKCNRLLNSSLVILNLCLHVVPIIFLLILYLLDSLSPPNWQLPKVDGYIWSCRLRPMAKRQNPPYLELIRPTKSSSQHPSLGFFISTYWASVLSSTPNSWWLEACLCQDS
jgi:hypothetical protein